MTVTRRDLALAAIERLTPVERATLTNYAYDNYRSRLGLMNRLREEGADPLLMQQLLEEPTR